MIHPVQVVLSSKDGSLLICVLRNMIHVYKFSVEGHNYQLIGEWVDDFDSTTLIKEKVIKEHQRQLAKKSDKKLKSNDGSAIEQSCKKPSVPVPGEGAPPVYQYIKCLALSQDESILVACTNSDKAVVILRIELEKSNCLSLLKRQPLAKRPNAVAFTNDDETLVIADKFGDVYAIPVLSEKVINSPEPILGHVSILTDIAMVKDKDGKHYILSADRDEHIKITHYPQSYIVDKWLFGHTQFVSTLCVPKWNPEILFSAGGDEVIKAWNWATGQLLSAFKVTDLMNPYLTDFHFPPKRFLVGDGSDRREISIGKVLAFDNIPYLITYAEATKAIFVLKFDSNTRELSHFKTLELPSNVVSLTIASNTNQLAVSLDRRGEQGNLIIFYNYVDGKFNEDNNKVYAIDEALQNTLSDNAIAQVDLQDIQPLYPIGQLRKRGEHYS
ncbi:HBR101Wp [Eremothecium sinecaudum]|uniref:HBR101Wp n=1 Tax=Eremothecium sinecaudum TaxID=45286 RepID=A0A109UX94_9SACH|nr:HBR101Wp [Eremothecium sinecaudum]AMD19002.1 HBR101Wp [Eremothecium sinecaudum]